jgi:hypothetical protein
MVVVRRHSSAHPCAASRGGDDFEHAAGGLDPVAHSGDAARFGPRLACEADAIVAD